MTEIVSQRTDCLSQTIVEQIKLRAAGRRKLVRHGGLLCSRCLVNPPANKRDRYCGDCRAAYNRARRATKTVEQTMTEIAAAIGRRIRASAKSTEQGT